MDSEENVKIVASKGGKHYARCLLVYNIIAYAPRLH